MNKEFIENLADILADSVTLKPVDSCHSRVVINAKSLENNLLRGLGENARRNLEIGILQDKLVKLGFKFGTLLSGRGYRVKGESIVNMSKKHIKLRFHVSFIQIFVENKGESSKFIGDYKIDSPTWQQDVLTKVKELING